MFKLTENNKNNYEIINSTKVDEFNLEIVELVHKVTKAKIVLMICDDKNKVFNIAFKTPVENGKGTPHILEHSVLCGSRKYNVKDPFIELAKSSMNTFLNAMTFPDKTCYPVASANIIDFHNLMDVYLDAVFYPNAVLDERIFRQEGWHYEIEKREETLKINGVVLNEMKGVYSNPDDILESLMLKNLYRGTNYEHDYGGNPSEILNLSFDEFKEFHRKYYSPSNAIIYYYGDLDFNIEIENLHTNYLKDFDFVDVNSRFDKVLDFKCDDEMLAYYNVDAKETKDKSYISYGFSIGIDKTNINRIAIDVIDYILFTSDSAIIKNKLLSLGLGEAVHSYVEFGLNEPLYSVIAQNIDASKKDLFKETILSSIQEIIDNGIDKDRFLASINTSHFVEAESDYGRTPRGLYFTLASLETYLYGGGADTFIGYKDAFNYIENIDLEDKNNIFYELLRKLFIDNPHRAFSVLEPKVGYSSDKDKELSLILDSKKAKMSDIELENIINECIKLKEYQSTKDSEEDIKCIPVLKVSDLSSDGVRLDYQLESINEIDIVNTHINDKEIVYLDINFDISNFSDEELYLVGLVSHILSKVDLKSMSYTEFDNYVSRHTGGIDIGLSVHEKSTFFKIEVKTTANKCKVAFDIIYKLISESLFVDEKRIFMILNELKANSTLSILSSGHVAAYVRAESSISYRGSVIDKVSNTGIAHYKFLNEIISNYDKHSKAINDIFHKLFLKVCKQKLCVTYSANKTYDSLVRGELDTFVSAFAKMKNTSVFDEASDKCLANEIGDLKIQIAFRSFGKEILKEAIVIPSDINFVSVSNVFDRDLYSGKLSAIKTLFNYEYLWTKIRVLGGAYGCMSSFDRAGVYAFMSYRDPNLSSTNDTFFGIYDYLSSIKLTDEMVEKFIIGAIGTFDNPLSTRLSYMLNMSCFFDGIVNDDIVRERNELVNMKSRDLNVVANIFKDINKSSCVALISESKMGEAKAFYDKLWRLMA